MSASSSASSSCSSNSSGCSGSSFSKHPALIDVELVANLILIVVFSGYENFVSRIDTRDHPSWPVWMTKIDFAGLKQKLLASIVAISAIHVLEAFLNIDRNFDATRMTWLVAVHLVFVIATLILALSDRWSAKE